MWLHEGDSNVLSACSEPYQIVTMPYTGFKLSIEARCWVENEDVVEVAPTGSAPTTSE